MKSITSSGIAPSERAFAVRAGALQAARHKLPQLIPDGLAPDDHLRAALGTVHPFLNHDVSTLPVRMALRWSSLLGDELIAKRSEVVSALEQLSAATAEEDELLLSTVHPNVRITLSAYEVKKLAFMREVSFVTSPRDLGAAASLATGLPMLGWTQSTWGLMERWRPPTVSIEEWLEGCESRNMKILRSMKEPEDKELAILASRSLWRKLRLAYWSGPSTT